MPVVVSDTSPIRALAHLDQMPILRSLFGEVLVPPAVAMELEQPSRSFRAVRLADFPWFQIRQPRDGQRVLQFRAELDPGESEALALALELRVPLLIDEAAGRAAAKRYGIEAIGVLGVLLRGKKAGGYPAVRPLIDRLQDELGFFVSPVLKAEILNRAGE